MSEKICKQARFSFVSNPSEPPPEMSPFTASDDDDDAACSISSSASASPARSDGDSSSVNSTPARPVPPKIPPSMWGCGISGLRTDRDDIRRKVMIPERLLAAMGEAVRSRDIAVAVDAALYEGWEDEEAPASPVMVFVNSRSGGRNGPILKGRLQKLIGEEQVLDLSVMKPSDFVQYSLACLERLAYLGDDCAKSTRENMRVMVAGGDGTVGWVLGCLGQLSIENRQPTPPVGIIPLGTGNDLSRSFGWGGSFPIQWRSAVKRSILKVINGPIYRLDSWQIIVSVAEGDLVELPHSLKCLGEKIITLDGEIEGMLPEKVFCFEGVFYNYFSIGMDAQVAYSFHHLRDEKPYLAQGPLSNKLIYTGYSCKQGWFFTPCMSDPSLRGLKNILRLSIRKCNSSEWEQILVPSNVRAIVVLNLHNYGSGRNPWGVLKPEYLEKRGFVEAQMDDGLLEIFGLKQGWHASLVMVELISAKHIAQASAIRLEIRGGEWKDAYMQMDGEPWKQPMNYDYSSIVEINRVPYQSLIVNGE